MKALSRLLVAGLVCCAAALLSGGDELSVSPREAVTAYGAQAAARRAEVGAELLPRRSAARFFTPLEDQYYVVEVGVYPADDRTIELKRGDFRLRAAGRTLKPQNPHAIATFLVQTARPEPGVQTTSHKSATIGVRMQTDRPTEVFREQRAGVGISSGRYWEPEDRDRMYRELAGLELPEGATTAPVAGYLYFAIKKGSSGGPLELIYRHAGENVVMALGGPR
jgi:hypothetical protein